MWKVPKTRIAAWVGLLSLATGTTMLVSVAPAAAARTYMTIQYATQYPDLGITYWASEGADSVTVDIPTSDNARIVFHDPHASSMMITDDLPGTPCTLDNATTISCPKFAYNVNSDLRKVFGVSIIGWGGNDQLGSSGAGKVYGSTYTPIGATLSGWENDDVLTAVGGYSYLVGGDGNDHLTSGPGSANFRDTADGGEGNDSIDTGTDSPDADGVYCRGGVDSLVKNGGDILFDPANCETVSLS